MSERRQFDVPEVLTALEAAVDRRGADYVYKAPRDENGDSPGCLYVHNRDTDNAAPGCIVGQVYYDLTGEFVPRWFESQNPGDMWTFSFDARRILCEAQEMQDKGNTWGDALAAAKKAASDDRPNP